MGLSFPGGSVETMSIGCNRLLTVTQYFFFQGRHTRKIQNAYIYIAFSLSDG
jgi:hypothetical protein